MSVINLGLIQAIYRGINPPANTAILWYDDNTGQKKHKYFNTATSTWDALQPAAGSAVWSQITGNINSQTDLINLISAAKTNIRGSVSTNGDTLEKIFNSINNDASFYSTIVGLLNQKAATNDSRFPTTSQKSALSGSYGTPDGSNTFVTTSDPRNTNSRTPTIHRSSHEAGGSDELVGNVNANARVGVRLENILIGIRRALNLIPGDGISLSVNDDSVNEKIDVTITNTGGGGGGGGYSDSQARSAIGNALVDSNSIDTSFSSSTPSFTFSLRRKTTSLASDEGTLKETVDGLSVQLGNASNQAAAGNDSRFPTSSEKSALVGDGSYTPSNSNPYVTLNYVLNLLKGLKWKNPARVATTANITLSGLQTIDGISVLSGESVLVKNQTAATENGIYIAASGAWVRRDDSDTAINLIGAAILVEEGTVNQDKLFQQTTDAITLGVTNIVYTNFGSGGSYTTDGEGVEISGTQISLEIDGNSLIKSGSGIKVKLKSSSLASSEGLITETINGLVVTLGTGANQAAAGNHTHTTTDVTEGTNFYFTVARVLATVLTSLSAASGTLAATDTILQAFGKIKYFIDNFNSTTRTITAVTGWTFSTPPILPSLSANQRLELDGSKNIISVTKATADNKDFASSVEETAGLVGDKISSPAGREIWWNSGVKALAVLLTGIVFSDSSAVTAADSILVAIGKLEAKYTALIGSSGTQTGTSIDMNIRYQTRTLAGVALAINSLTNTTLGRVVRLQIDSQNLALGTGSQTGATVTATTGIFNSGHVGRYIDVNGLRRLITAYTSSTVVSVDISSTIAAGSTIKLIDTFDFGTISGFTRQDAGAIFVDGVVNEVYIEITSANTYRTMINQIS